jgi:tetratricopeptide (TPR) repeat protein
MYLEKKPEAILTAYNYGKLLLNSGDLIKADSIFTKLSKTNPNNPNFYYYRGLIREELKDTTAFNYFLQTYTLDNNHQNALYKIAKFNLENREFTKATPYIEKGLKADVNSVRFITLNALKNYHTKEYHNAIAAYLKLIELKQSNTQLHENLAISYHKTNQFEKAIDQFTILINTYDDTNPTYHYNLGKVYMSLKEYENAKRHIEISIVLQDIPLDEEYISLSYIYDREKNYKEEMEVLEKALKENPTNEIAKYRLAIAADNYFKDKETVLRYYNAYLDMYRETGKMREIVKQRVSDLKKELHFTKD